MRALRVAGIQVESRNFDVVGNLRRAEAQVAVAAGRGAELILCPEFLAPGYLYHRSIWDVAEPRGGPTERWLASMARQYRIYIGASYLEADGNDFFNTFTLMLADGELAGRVRKESLPGFEAWFIRSCSGPKVIETELGRIGVGICWDNSTARFMRRVSDEQMDLLLMPHSAPSITCGPLTLSGDHDRHMLRGVAGFYASEFGIPTIMANKAAGEDSSSPVPCAPIVRLRFHFLGQSTICQADGSVADQIDERPGVVVADVVLGGGKRHPQLPKGYWSRPGRWFSGAWAALLRALECTGKVAYRIRWLTRRRAARKARARGVASDFDPSVS
jgi:N-carbamoylputrescine amidase